MEWILLNSQLYYQQFLHNVSISADPPLNNLMFIGNMKAQLTLSYNTMYNVSITQYSTCQQLVRTKSLLLNYSKLYVIIVHKNEMIVLLADNCNDPMELTTALAVDYVDPALEGQIITFTCPHGQILNGSNTSTCMGNGIWEPDPGEITCTGTSVSTSVTTSSTHDMIGTHTSCAMLQQCQLGLVINVYRQ